jgi:hypothetical protein
VVVAFCAAGALQMAEVRSCFGAVYSNTARLAASMVLEHSTRVFFFFLLFSVIKRRRLMGQWWWSVCSSVMWSFMHTNKVVYFNNPDKENALTV